MEKATINIQFQIVFTNEDNGFAFVDRPDTSASGYYGSHAKARQGLRKQLTVVVNDALRQLAEHRQRILGCGDGTVLIIQFRHGAWGYGIAGPGRKHMSSCGGYTTLEECEQQAKTHADQSYGGVVWEV